MSASGMRPSKHYTKTIQGVVDGCIRECGHRGWALLVPRLRAALIAEAVFSLLRRRDGDSIKIEDADRMLADALRAAGMEA